MRPIFFLFLMSLLLLSCNEKPNESNQDSSDHDPNSVAGLLIDSDESTKAQNPRNTNITLWVRADALFNDPENNVQSVVDSYCELSDDRNNPSPQPIMNFISDVNADRVVKWQAISLETENLDPKLFDPVDLTKQYQLRIVQVNKKDGLSTNFFDKVILPGNSGKVIAISNGNAVGGNEYEYNIWFSVTHDGQTLFFKIDPKLRGNN